MKLKAETTAKERDQKSLDFMNIDVIKIEQQHPSSQEIITIPMTPITNSYFNKHPISWELIYRRLLHPYDSVMKIMCRHPTLDGLQKQFPKKINKAPCTIFYTEKKTTLPKGKKVDNSNIQTGELIHMKFEF